MIKKLAAAFTAIALLAFATACGAGEDSRPVESESVTPVTNPVKPNGVTPVTKQVEPDNATPIPKPVEPDSAPRPRWSGWSNGRTVGPSRHCRSCGWSTRVDRLEDLLKGTTGSSKTRLIQSSRITPSGREFVNTQRSFRDRTSPSESTPTRGRPRCSPRCSPGRGPSWWVV